MSKLMITKESVTKAEGVIVANWNIDHTRPSDKHYEKAQFKWDSCFAAITNASRGDPTKAATEINTLLRYIDPLDGFIPNMRFTKPPGFFNIESYTFNKRAFGSNYTQPPLIAHAAFRTFESFRRKGLPEEGIRFLQTIYGETMPEKLSGLKGVYKYFETRENGNGSEIVGNIHPNETGRDSDPPLKFGSVRIPNKGIIAKFTPAGTSIIPLVNTALDAMSHFRINLNAKKHEWKVEKVRDRYWTNDVMFNCLYANNLSYMARISSELGLMDDTKNYKEKANRIEGEILDKMWDEKTGFFYNLDRSGNKIPIASITGLFPIVLDTISKHQLSSLLDKMEDPEWFNTQYPIPSLPTNSPYYDPERKVKRLWQGPVWINTNFLIAEEGLVKQIERFSEDPQLCDRMVKILGNLVEKTEELVEKNGFRECYSPETGKGYRVENFTWSLLALFFDKSKALLGEYKKTRGR